jgi:hypothetical protein
MWLTITDFCALKLMACGLQLSFRSSSTSLRFSTKWLRMAMQADGQHPRRVALTKGMDAPALFNEKRSLDINTMPYSAIDALPRTFFRRS